MGTRLNFCLLLHAYLASLTAIRLRSLFYLILIYLEGGSGGGDLTGNSFVDKRKGLEIFLPETLGVGISGRWERETGLAGVVS